MAISSRMRSTLLLTLMATVVISTHADQWPFADGDEYTLAQVFIYCLKIKKTRFFLSDHKCAIHFYQPLGTNKYFSLLHLKINITYYDPPTNVHSDVAEMGKFGTGRVGTTAGLLVHVRSGNSSSHHGCELNYDNDLPVICPSYFQLKP